MLGIKKKKKDDSFCSQFPRLQAIVFVPWNMVLWWSRTSRHWKLLEDFSLHGRGQAAVGWGSGERLGTVYGLQKYSPSDLLAWVGPCFLKTAISLNITKFRPVHLILWGTFHIATKTERWDFCFCLHKNVTLFIKNLFARQCPVRHTFKAVLKTQLFKVSTPGRVKEKRNYIAK